jgi:subfamily B ATP-binding cassette protein MsbA
LSSGHKIETPPPLSTAALVRRLVREHVRRYTPRLSLALVNMVLVAGTTALLAKLIEPVLDQVFTLHDPAMLKYVAIGIMATFVVKGAASYAESVIMNATGQRIVADLQSRMFRHLIGADLAFFNNTSTGLLIARFTNDVSLLRNVVTNTLTSLGKDVLSVVFLVAVMFYQDWVLASVAFIAFPTAILPIARIGRRMRKVSANTQAETAQFSTLLEQVFQGARHVKAYGMEEYEATRAEQVIRRILKLVSKAGSVRAISSPIMETLGGVAIVAVIVYGGAQVISGERTTGTFFSFITALLLAYEPVKRLANLNTSLQEGLAAAQRVFAVLDIAPEITERADPVALQVKQGEIRFEGVRFAYHDGAEALRGIDLIIPAGKRVALVGPSGAGKSTILNLIPRFYDVTGGRIAIDGVDVRDASFASLRANIALVAQEVALFDDTVRANIAYGRLSASEDEIVAAARNAAAHEFILQLPQGYDTAVGELGVKLSGGQRQRLAIARAMLKNAPILLLDEATSALDTESERQVQDALAALMTGRTVLVIAHRLSTVVDADLIAVIEGGQATEQGTHAELLARGGAYARLYALQFADQADAPPAGAAKIAALG